MRLHLSQSREHLCNLLSYAEEVLKVGERIISDLSKDSLLTFYEHEIANIEGVSTSTHENAWLTVARLHEIEPPEPNEEFSPWLVMQAKPGVFDRPRLKDSLIVKLTPERVSDLAEGGFASSEDVLTPFGDTEESDEIEVQLRLANLAVFAALFNAWVDDEWAAWAEREKPRRRCIAVYNRLFEVQQRMLAMGDDAAVEAVFSVGMARWAHERGRVNAPLIESSVELELDPDDGCIRVRPRDRGPALALRAFEPLEIGALGRLQRDAGAHLKRLYDDPDIGFCPFERPSFEPVLRMCHARLSGSAAYEPDAREDRSDRTSPHDRSDASNYRHMGLVCSTAIV